VAAWHDIDWLDGVEQVLEAHGAVVVHGVLYAHVAVPEADRVAAVACGAVEEVAAASHTADAALPEGKGGEG
jgi:hypothetical protein